MVNNVSGNEASEIRSAFKCLATISIEEILVLGGIFCLFPEKKTFPEIFKITFCCPLWSNIIILIKSSECKEEDHH